MPRLLVLLAVFLAACRSDVSEQVPAPVAQGAALPPTLENAEKSKPEPDPPSKPDKLKIEWFTGVVSLPESHECHDSTPIVSARDQLDQTWKFRITTLGEHRAKNDTSWTYIGPRTVQGVRWFDGDTEHVVATCHMTGTGFRQLTPGYLDHYDFDPEDAYFIEGFVGEANNIERASIRWMHRGPDGKWETTRHEVDWAGNDEGNDPEFIARMRLLSASDHDQDRVPELVWMHIGNHGPIDSADWECPGPTMGDKPAPIFDVGVVAEEGTESVTRLFHVGGKHLENVRKAQNEDLTTDSVLWTLLERHAEDALAGAKWTIRNSDKLRWRFDAASD